MDQRPELAQLQLARTVGVVLGQGGLLDLLGLLELHPGLLKRAAHLRVPQGATGQGARATLLHLAALEPVGFAAARHSPLLLLLELLEGLAHVGGDEAAHGRHTRHQGRRRVELALCLLELPVLRGLGLAQLLMGHGQLLQLLEPQRGDHVRELAQL